MNAERGTPPAERQASRVSSLPRAPHRREPRAIRGAVDLPHWLWTLSAVAALAVAGCWSPPRPEQPAQETRPPARANESGDTASSPPDAPPPSGDVASQAEHPWNVDLRRDEQRGGHTVARHIGRTDAQLKARLRRESIAAASTYADVESAERVVARALAENARRVQRWIDQRSPKTNLAIRYRARDGLPTGRLLRRGANESEDVTGAVVVLRWRDDEWYVLTTYPENPR